MPTVQLQDPRLSPEVKSYLKDRRIPFPTSPPAILTPEPFNFPGAVFDYERVDRVLDVFGRLRHTQGEWAGLPLKPDPWEIAYILAPIFGWVAPVYNLAGKQVGWARIIRKAYVEVPRKNGKTTLAGGIATYLTTADGEAGAQVFAVATGKQQARYCFDPVKFIAQKSPDLGPYVKITNDRIVHVPSGSFFTAVSSLAELLHGANVHGGIIDELHVHKTDKLLVAVETGTAGRRQALVLIITTSDDSRQDTVYDQRRKRIEQLADRVFEDPTTYGVVWMATAEDDPFAEETWKKANPGYGISPTRSFMMSAATEAKQSPANLANFLRLHLNRRTKQETRYIEMPSWDGCGMDIDEKELEGRWCYGGLDLAATSDLCALCWVFPHKGGHYALWRLWIPEGDEDSRAGMIALTTRTAGMAKVWVDAKYLTVTPGNVADYGYIREQINKDRIRFRVQEIAYDPYNSSQLVTDLVGDGALMMPTRQGFASLSAPTKELQKLLRGGPEEPRFLHQRNPAARWCVDNFAVEMDAQGNVKPSRKKASDKIDAVVASILGLDRAMRAAGEYELTASVH